MASLVAAAAWRAGATMRRNKYTTHKLYLKSYHEIVQNLQNCTSFLRRFLHNLWYDLRYDKLYQKLYPKIHLTDWALVELREIATLSQPMLHSIID